MKKWLAILAVLLFASCGRDGNPVSTPVQHLFGTVTTIEFPGQKPQQYFQWCDPKGYRLYTNGFADNSPITVVEDARCNGVK